MKTFIFRNNTIENLFLNNNDISFSNYDSIHFDENEYESYLWFYNTPIKEDSIDLIEEVIDYIDRIKLIVEKIPKNKFFIILTLEDICINRFEHNNWNLKNTINKFNQFIYNLSLSYINVKIVDFSLFLRKYPENYLIDWRYYFLSKTIINPLLANDFKKWFESQINAINQIRKKCLVLDLDNTIWGGVLGEDGINGILLNDNYPGNSYKQFQKGILELKKIGVILAICSKNNLKDVEELWRKNDQMILKSNDFVSIRINWNDKASNINEIAKELNIGLDSIVFVDDNPTERDLVKTLLPEVSVPDFPKKPYELSIFLNKIYNNYFNTYRITEDDVNKTTQYKSNFDRENSKSKFSTFESYLKGLNINIVFVNANEDNILRFAQLTHKTNQFNLTTKRYTETDLQKFIFNDDWVIGIKVEDKFGDLGHTGLIIVQFIDKDKCYIDTFLLSCRILGKGIEHAYIRYILNNLKKIGIKYVYASYVLSQKNQQVCDFFEKEGFEVISNDNNVKEYLFNLGTQVIKDIETYYKINE